MTDATKTVEEAPVKTDELFPEDSDGKAEDVLEGLIAESDPNTRMRTISEALATPAIDIVKESLDGVLTSRARETAKELAKSEKVKVSIPRNPLTKKSEQHHDFVVVTINGHIFTIKRDIAVLVPEEVYYLLLDGGYNPTLVR